LDLSNVEEEVRAPTELGEPVRDEMYELFTAYYDAVLRQTFEEDLSNKDFVILLREADRRLVGFSTLSVHEMSSGAERVRYVYSGDSVIRSEYWGPGHLLKSWFRLAGSIKAQRPETKLYWLLLVMGHRTYRILGDFFQRYAPRFMEEPDPVLIGLRDQFVRMKFGDCFDPSTGLITFPESRGQLATHLQDAKDFLNRPLVRDFVKLNPHHPRGVELACIAELSEANLKSYARSEFGRGMRAQPGRLA
jgi:hypothetical protein